MDPLLESGFGPIQLVQERSEYKILFIFHLLFCHTIPILAKHYQSNETFTWLIHDQDEKLIEAVKTHGNSWKSIQKIYYPGRAADHVKNRFATAKLGRLGIYLTWR